MDGQLIILGPLRLPAGMAEQMGSEVAGARQAVLHYIENMEKVYHLIEEPEVAGWLTGILPSVGVQVEDLSHFYRTSAPDLNLLHLEVAEWILQSVRLGMATAAVFSGRPERCVPPATAAASLALNSGIPVAMLPHVFTLPDLWRPGTF